MINVIRKLKNASFIIKGEGRNNKRFYLLLIITLPGMLDEK